MFEQICLCTNAYGLFLYKGRTNNEPITTTQSFTVTQLTVNLQSPRSREPNRVAAASGHSCVRRSWLELARVCIQRPNSVHITDTTSNEHFSTQPSDTITKLTL